MGTRLFLLYFTAIVGGILAVQLFLLAVIVHFSGASSMAALQVLIAAGIATLWALIGWWRIRKGDHECRIEVAKVLYPTAVFYTILSSVGLAAYLKMEIPEAGNNPYLLIIAAIPIVGYLILRWSEMRFMRSIHD